MDTQITWSKISAGSYAASVPEVNRVYFAAKVDSVAWVVKVTNLREQYNADVLTVTDTLKEAKVRVARDVEHELADSYEVVDDDEARDAYEAETAAQFADSAACPDHDDDFGCCDVCGRWADDTTFVQDDAEAAGADFLRTDVVYTHVANPSPSYIASLEAEYGKRVEVAPYLRTDTEAPYVTKRLTFYQAASLLADDLGYDSDEEAGRFLLGLSRRNLTGQTVSQTGDFAWAGCKTPGVTVSVDLAWPEDKPRYTVAWTPSIVGPVAHKWAKELAEEFAASNRRTGR